MEKSNASHASAEAAPEASEADFLAEQAAAAARALSATLERMRSDLGDSADLAAWTRRYPWPTMGVAAAAGFLAAVAIGSPSGSRSGESSAVSEESDSPDQGPPGRPSRGRRRSETDNSLFHTLMSEILRNFANAAQGALLAAIGARFGSPPAPTENAPPVADPTVVGTSDGNGFAPSES